MSSSVWNAISGQPQSADFLVPGKVNIEFADERTRRQTADTELHKLRDRLAQRIRYSKQVDEIALSLVASTSMDKSSCVDFSELKEALSAALPPPEKAELHKLQDRNAQRILCSKQAEEIALSLVISPSMDKSSCVDFSELKEALTAVMMTSKKADVANGFLSQGDTKRFRP